jgi:hypothetical protein
MLVELYVFVIKLDVAKNPVKILSRQNYSALLAPSEQFLLLLLHHPLPLQTNTHKRIFHVGLQTIGLEIGTVA